MAKRAAKSKAESTAKTKKKVATPTNPYLAARSEYDSRYGDQAKQRNRWQAMSFLLAIVVVGFSFQVMKMAGQSRVQPYIIKEDAQGGVQYVGPANQMADPSRRMLVSELSRFVVSIRSVSSDPLTQRQLVASGYGYADQKAAQFMNAYFSVSENNPVLLGKKFARLVDIRSVLPVPESQAWKVEWTETVLPVSQGAPSVSNWEGFFTVRLSPPKSADALVKNPLGLYVTDINWTQMSEPRVLSTEATRGR